MTWYTGDPAYDTLLAIAFGVVALVGVAGVFVQSPYGRFADERFGIHVDPRLGWFLLELPASVVFLWTFLQGSHRSSPFALVVLALWVVHYANRGFVMPALMRVPSGGTQSFSLAAVSVGWVVTSLHGYLNGAWASTYAPMAQTGWAWLSDPRFVAGLAIWALALAANLHADHTVRTLRTQEEVDQGIRRYRIPRGGLFEYVTNASYLTEILAWTGFALLTWSLAGVYIVAISVANLVPRAAATHRWYREKFPDYPSGRKILIPGIW